MNRAATLASLAYLAAILYLSLYPWTFTQAPHAAWLQWSIEGTPRRVLLDAALNVGFYVPLGATVAVALGRRPWRIPVAIALGIAVSFMVEYLQLSLPERDSSYIDLCTNSIGTVIGAAGAAFFTSSRRGRGWSRLWRIGPTGGFLLCLWGLSQTFPCMPMLTLLRGEAALGAMLARSLDAADAALGFMALWMIVVLVDGPGWWGVAFAVVPAQAFIVLHTLSPARLFGAAAGVALAAPFRRRLPRRTHAGIVVLWLVYEELRPFRLVAPHPFYWLPFEGLMTGAPDSYATMIFLKLFLYGAIVAIVRRSGTSWLASIGAPAMVLACGELAQQYLPGRTPETTDLVLLLAAAGLVAAGERAGSGGSARTG